MKLKNFFKLILFLLFCSNTFAEEILDKKVKKLTLELRCMTCQNQSVYDSDSDFAKDLKIIVKEKFKEGLSESEIKNFLTQRYGEYILFKPYFTPKNLILWLFPFILVGFSLYIFFRKIKKN